MTKRKKQPCLGAERLLVRGFGGGSGRERRAAAAAPTRRSPSEGAGEAGGSPDPGSAQGRDTELIVSVLLHNSVALTLCHVQILNCLFISHPPFILIVPDKQGHFTFVFSVRAYRAYLCRPRDFQSLPVALVDAEE